VCCGELRCWSKYVVQAKHEEEKAFVYLKSKMHFKKVSIMEQISIVCSEYPMSDTFLHFLIDSTV
jgi:hypothetical protein